MSLFQKSKYHGLQGTSCWIFWWKGYSNLDEKWKFPTLECVIDVVYKQPWNFHFFWEFVPLIILHRQTLNMNNKLNVALGSTLLNMNNKLNIALSSTLLVDNCSSKNICFLNKIKCDFTPIVINTTIIIASLLFFK